MLPPTKSALPCDETRQACTLFFLIAEKPDDELDFEMSVPEPPDIDAWCRFASKLGNESACATRNVPLPPD